MAGMQAAGYQEVACSFWRRLHEYRGFYFQETVVNENLARGLVDLVPEHELLL